MFIPALLIKLKSGNNPGVHPQENAYTTRATSVEKDRAADTCSNTNDRSGEAPARANLVSRLVKSFSAFLHPTEAFHCETAAEM